MKNLSIIKARFLKDPFKIKMGNLAADLARLSSFSENIKNKKTIESILEESKFFIEWLTPEAPLEIQTLLSQIQLKLALWHLSFLQKKETYIEIKELREKTKNWSMDLLKMSGFLT